MNALWMSMLQQRGRRPLRSLSQLPLLVWRLMWDARFLKAIKGDNMTGQVTTTNTTTEVVECVPNDVWVQTFQHLEPADLGSFAQVCTIFNTVIRQDAVWVGFPED